MNLHRRRLGWCSHQSLMAATSFTSSATRRQQGIQLQEKRINRIGIRGIFSWLESCVQSAQQRFVYLIRLSCVRVRTEKCSRYRRACCAVVFNVCNFFSKKFRVCDFPLFNFQLPPSICSIFNCRPLFNFQFAYIYKL